jgi:protein phosphatase 1 regulatory subunit 11
MSTGRSIQIVSVGTPNQVVPDSSATGRDDDRGGSSSVALVGPRGGAETASVTTTVTLTETPTVPGESANEILRLTLAARPTVRWDENVQDNEGMGKKSSKRCCIFHKQRDFGESSTDSSADGNDSDGGSSFDSGDDKKPKATGRRKIAKPKQTKTATPDHQRFHA